MERLILIPTQHWRKDELIGVSIYVQKEGDGFVGCLTMRPVDLEEASNRAVRYFNQAGYSTTTMLWGEELNSDSLLPQRIV